MNLQELDKVIELINGLGDAASDGFVYWLWLQVFNMVWPSLIFLVVVWVVYKLVSPFTFNLMATSRATKLADALKAELGVGSAGDLTNGEGTRVLHEVRILKRAVRTEHSS